MRLIDADALEKEIRFYDKTLNQNIKHSLTKDFRPSRDFVRGVEDGYCRILSALQAQPTIDPVKHGRWVKLDMHPHLADHKCTACGESAYVPTCMGEPMYLFCPNCGALMREDGEEG